MRWFKNRFSEVKKPAEVNMVELTQFTLNDSKEILIASDNIVEELLAHISEQQRQLEEKENHIAVLEYRLSYLGSVIEQMKDWKLFAS